MYLCIEVPWVYISDSASNWKHLLEVVDEAWSPFKFGSDAVSDGKETSVTSSWFQQLIQKMNNKANEPEESDIKIENLKKALVAEECNNYSYSGARDMNLQSLHISFQVS